jgi:hypothetical protein
MNIKILLLFLFFPFIVNGQNYDVRKTSWGMSIKEVENSEYPFQGVVEKSISGGNSELWFDNIDFGSPDRKAFLGYIFNSLNELDEVRFIIPKTNFETKNFYPLSYRMKRMYPFLSTLKDKGYVIHQDGWQSPLGKDEALSSCVGNKKESILDSDLDDLYNCAIEIQYFYNTINLPFVSERTEAQLAFPVKLDENAFKNIMGWVIFKPTKKHSNSAF